MLYCQVMLLLCLVMRCDAALLLCDPATTHLDVPENLADEHAPQHGAVLHLKACQLDRNVLKVGHVQGPRQGPASPPGARRQVPPETACMGSKLSQDKGSWSSSPVLSAASADSPPWKLRTRAAAVLKTLNKFFCIFMFVC